MYDFASAYVLARTLEIVASAATIGFIITALVQD